MNMGATRGEVGSRKLYEDDSIVLWEFELAPGAKTPCHTHEHDYLFHVLAGTRLEVFDAEDRYLGAFDSPTGATFTLRRDGDDLVSTDDKGLRAPATHSARNAGTDTYREILVEKKR
jgi:redox-sensitive bicupin YhaK (pirin superfamily)